MYHGNKRESHVIAIHPEEPYSVYKYVNTFSPNFTIPIMICSCQEGLGF